MRSASLAPNMSPALPELQRAFAAALLREGDRDVWDAIADDGFTAAERLRIYRNTCRSTLVATLRMTYPAAACLVGDDFFERAAAAYVEVHPARSGYLNDYGGEFGHFLAGFAPASTLPYLADVACFEWALSVAANAEDAPVLGPEALLAVPAERHAQLRLVPHPSLTCLELAYAADEIADAVLSGNEAAMREVDLASGPVRLVVHRGAEGLETQRLELHGFDFLLRLCAGEPLERLLEIGRNDAPALLAEQLVKGRLSAFRS